MSIDDLKTRQKAALKTAASWEALTKNLEEGFRAALASLEFKVKERADGLELGVHQPSQLPYFLASASSCEVSGGEWLELRVPGVEKEVGIATLACYLKRNADGLWIIHVWETGRSDHRLELDAVLRKPCIPLRVGWTRNVWWGGPEDNDKLANAIMDVLLERSQPQDFTLKDLDEPKGCVLLFGIILFAWRIAEAFTR